MVVIYPIHTLPPSLMVSWSHGEISHGTMSFLMVSRWDNLMVPWVSSWSHGCDICHPHTTPLSHGLMVSRWDISWYHEYPHGLMVRYLMVPWVSSWSHGEIISWYHEFPHGVMVVIYPIDTLPPSLMVSWSHGEISHGTMSFLMVSRWDNLMVPWVSSWSHGCDICHPHTTPLSHGLMVSRWDISGYHEFPHGLTVRNLMVTWVSSWSHGEIISSYHEFPHVLMVVIYPIHTLPPSLMVSWSHGEISHGTMSFLMVSRWDNLMVPWVSSWSHGCDICHPHTTPLSLLNFTLKFTYTKNLNFISHNLLPGEPSLRFSFKSKERKTFPVLTVKSTTNFHS